MSVKRLAITGLMLVTALVVSSAAQNNEAAALIGRTFISDQGIPGATFTPNFISSGNGLTIEGDVAHKLRELGLLSLWVEVPFAFNPDEDLQTGANLIPSQYSSFFVTPAARVNLFTKAVLSPFLSVGGGYGHFNESKTLNQGTPNPGKTGTNTGVFQIGAGFEAKPWQTLGFRLDVRDFWSGVPQLNVNTGKSRQHNILVGVGVVFHF
jgi:hypothetical protein